MVGTWGVPGRGGWAAEVGVLVTDIAGIGVPVTEVAGIGVPVTEVAGIEVPGTNVGKCGVFRGIWHSGLSTYSSG